MYQTVDFYLKTFVRLTPADAYTILRATSLNNLLRFLIDWLKRETISMYSLILNIFQFPFEKCYITYIVCIIDENKCSKSEKTGLVPVPSNALFNGIGANRGIFLKKPISQELNQIQLAIKSV